jgi:hypothetical protein
MKSVKVVSALALAIVGAACAVEKSKNPLSPTLAGPIPGIEISAPKPLEPAPGALIPGDKQPVTLLLENASSNGPRPLTYVFEVATDAGFTNRVFSRDSIPPGDNGRTSVRLPDPLGTGRQYYWRGRAQDGANAGPYSAAVNFDIFTPVAFDKPTLLAPVNNDRTASARPEFRFANAPRVGQPTPVTYAVELGTSDSFATKIAAWQFSEQPNETKFTAPVDLPVNTQIFWRVRPFEATALGPWSDVAVFRTPVPVVVAPSPTPSPAPGGSCTGSQPLSIVECRRKQYAGHMSSSQVVAFLKGVAADLNKNGIGGGPFGLLRKTNGASCGGYSCDIICSGQGTSQKQWDILGDSDAAQTPAWIGPKVYPDIRVDTCEIQ